MDKAEKPRGKGTKKRRISRFLIGILILLAVNAIIIGVVLRWLYVSLEDFEQHTPNTALTTYFSQLHAGEYEEIMRTSRFIPDAGSSWDDYFSLLKERFDTDPATLSFRKTSSRDISAGDQLYAVYSGEDKLGEVLLFEDEGTPSGWAVYSAVDFIEGYTITALPSVTVFVNDVQLDASGVVQTLPVTVSYMSGETPVTVDIFSKMNDPSLAPVLVQYETSQSLRAPVITATAADGTELPVVVDDAQHTATVLSPPTPDQEAQAVSTIETVAKAYSDFITEDGTLANILQYVSTDTALHQEFREYQRGWYLNHESREFLDFSFSDINYYSDTCFIGHTDFTVNITRQGELHTFYASYDMAFMYLDGQWLLVGMHARPV